MERTLSKNMSQKVIFSLCALSLSLFSAIFAAWLNEKKK